MNKDIKNIKKIGPQKYLNVILLISACTFGLFALVNAFNGKVLIAFSELLITCMYLVNLLAFSRHKNYQFAAAVSLISTFFGLLIIFFEGGISNSGILWLLIFPPAAFFLQGRKKGAWWNGALLSVLIAIFFLSWFDVLLIHYELLFFRQFIVAFLVLSLISYAYQYSIEENEQRLTQNQKELIEANDALQIVRKKQKDASRFPLDNPAPVFRTTLSGDVAFANDAARSIILDCKDNGSCTLDPDFFHIVTQKIKKNPKIRLERKTGSETYSYDVVRVRNAYLNFYGRNITKEKEAEEVKTEFVSLASHQLRTPITSINWFLKLLSSNKHGELNAKQKDFLNEILAASEQMSELVEDLLDVSRLDKNEGFIELEDIALLPLLEEVVRNNKSLIEKKDIHFEYLILCSTDIKVRADGEKVKTVIDNILNNAIKYSHTGGDVILKLDCSDENVVAEVQDKGIGVPEKDRALIFNRFTRAENASESGEQGTGLGLYLSQKIIKKHGGSLALDSVEGEGTQVKIILPHNTN